MAPPSPGRTLTTYRSPLGPRSKSFVGDLLSIRIVECAIEYELEANDVSKVISTFADVDSIYIPPNDKSKAYVKVPFGEGCSVVDCLNGRKLQGMEGALEVLICVDDTSDIEQFLSPPIGSDTQFHDNNNDNNNNDNDDDDDQYWPMPPKQLQQPNELARATAALPVGRLLGGVDITEFQKMMTDPEQYSFFESSAVADGPAVRGEPLLSNTDLTPLPASGDHNTSILVPPLPGKSTPVGTRCRKAARPPTGLGEENHQAASSSKAMGDESSLSPAHGRKVIINSVLRSEPGGSNVNDEGEGGGAGANGKLRKWTARYEIQIPPDNTFQVTRKVIGNRGANMKRINEATGAKLRLRGKGSGYLEGVNRQEAEDPLHLCISSCESRLYQKARRAVDLLLTSIYKEYDVWSVENGAAPPHLTIRCKELFLNNSKSRGAGGGDDSEVPVPSTTSNARRKNGGRNGGGEHHCASHQRKSRE